jgi:hypothetical protein
MIVYLNYKINLSLEYRSRSTHIAQHRFIMSSLQYSNRTAIKYLSEAGMSKKKKKK